MRRRSYHRNQYQDGFNPNLVILSDDAGQFHLLHHALCWIHAERTIHKLIPFSDQQRIDLEQVRDQIWEFYKDLKGYKLKTGERKKRRLEKRFDAIFTQKTSFATLNCALNRGYEVRVKLLNKGRFSGLTRS